MDALSPKGSPTFIYHPSGDANTLMGICALAVRIFAYILAFNENVYLGISYTISTTADIVGVLFSG